MNDKYLERYVDKVFFDLIHKLCNIVNIVLNFGTKKSVDYWIQRFATRRN